MSFARFLIPRRKENVLNFLIIAAFCAIVILYYKLDSRTLFLGRKESRLSKRSWKQESMAPGAPGENGRGVLLYGEHKKQGQRDMKKWFMNVEAR
ncbi:hypothetical protein TELCIR_04144 [Teladorsagia circumcincta]|uniref:Uncharacterized protein n=1 Tax=Teladorsagia circumcincta TaxID=45464 RepID=A0A2G9UWK3_TELCI|nr:hypothetical protein TELCIR_04144 [Teladorsagia circumcincta]